MFIRKHVLREGEPGQSGGAGTGDDLKALQRKLDLVSDEVDRLRTHNKTLLDEKKQVKGQLDEFKTTIGDIKADDLKKMMETLSSSEDAKLIAEGKLDEVITRRVEKLQSKLEGQIADLSEQLTKSKESYAKLSSEYSEERVSSAVRQAAEKLSVIPTAIEDVVLRSKGIFSIGEDGTIEARDAEGNLLKVDKKVMNPENFVKSLEKTAPHFWPASTGAGATGGSGKEVTDNPFHKDTFNLTKQAQLRKENPELAGELKAAAEKKQ